MLIVAYLTFCSTGESSVHPWLAAHCTHIYRSSPRHCERAAGWKFPRGSEGVGANMCWWMHVAQWERSWFSRLFSCLERRNFWFPLRFVVSSSSVLLVFRRSEQSVRLTFDLCLHLIRMPLGRFSVLLCLVLKTTRRHKVLLPVGHETIMQRQTFLHKSLHMMSFTACSLLLNCQVLHLLLWLIRICLSASSPRVFYRLECPVRCKLFFNPRFVKSQHSLSHICLMKMLINRAPVLHIGPFNLVKFFIAINYLLHWSCNMLKSSIDPATCLNLSLLHLYFLLSRLNTPPVVFSWCFWNHVCIYSENLWETFFPLMQNFFLSLNDCRSTRTWREKSDLHQQWVPSLCRSDAPSRNAMWVSFYKVTTRLWL